MSSHAKVIEFPARRKVGEPNSFERDMVLALATADDLGSGMAFVAERIRRRSGAAGVEWWAPGDDGMLELRVATGPPRGVRHSLALGPAGMFVFHGGRLDPQIDSALMSLAGIIRHRAAEERLAQTTIELARRNEALEDFAALVAHELKTPLNAALVADDPSGPVEDALLLVDALLEASRNGPSDETSASVIESLEQAVEDLRAEIEITADVAATLPLSPPALRVILRNVLSNAVAAEAVHVRLTAVRSSFSWRLLVDDDGVGLAAVDRYDGGAGLGLSLCRRIAARFGGTVELAARPSGGARATLTLPAALL
jgi:signal transduction histidine kinase